MNRMQWKDLLREIRKNKGRFLSLLFIVALGCAFYSGIRSSEPDMTASVDHYYDSTGFCDIRLLSNLGLTEEDLKAVAETDGVLDCEGSYNLELFAECENDEPIMNVVSLCERLNRFTVKQGRLPESADECFVDVRYMNNTGAKLGDTITLLNTDKEAPDTLDRNTFTITGCGTWAWYLNLTRGTASIGDGSVDAFLVLRPEVFTQDYYTTIYATVEGAAEVNSYSESYDTIVSRVMDSLEDIADLRVQLRRDALVAEGEEALADAREQIADARAELQDAEEQLKDKEAEYADGLAAYENGKKELEDGIKTYEDGCRQLADGRAQYSEGKEAYESGKTEYEKGLAEYQDGLKQFEEGGIQLDAAREELDQGWTAYRAGYEEYDAGRKLLDEKEAELLQGEAELAAAEEYLQQQKDLAEQTKAELLEQKAELLKQQSELPGQKEALLSQRADLQHQKEELLQTREELTSQRSTVSGQKRLLDAAYGPLVTQRDNLSRRIEQLQSQRVDLLAQIEELEGAEDSEENSAALTELRRRLQQAELGIRTANALLPALNQGIQQLETTLQQINDGLAQIDDGLAQIDDGIAQIDDGIVQIDDGIAQIDDGLAQIEEGLPQLEDGLAQVEEGLLQIEEGYKELNANKLLAEEGRRELTAGKELLQESGKELDAARTTLTEGENAYAAGREEYLQNEKKLTDAGKLLASSRGQLTDAKKQLDDAYREIVDGEKELADAAGEIEDGKAELADAEVTLTDARKELDDGWQEYHDARAEADEKIADAMAEIEDGEKQLAKFPEGKWYVLNRDTIQTCVEYGMDAERIGKIADVFPVIFFLVAALVCLTTMTRMIEEERMLIGTMKALGYGKISIIAKYLVYAFSATLIGGILGVLVGSKLLPYVIMQAYGMLYTNVPYRLMPYHLSHSLTAIGLAMLFTVGAAFAACFKELLATPAALMRPPAPKTGRKILLERIPFLWSRLNFSMKSTARNLFRYKKRLFMTILGIGGCMAVLLVSYGLHDSISAIVDNQYKNIWTYSASCNIDEKLSLAEKETLRERIAAEPAVLATMLTRNASLDISTETASKTAYIYVVEDTSAMSAFVDLHDRLTHESYQLSEEGVILSEKLARVLAVAPGDEVTLKISDTEYRQVTVTAAAENYLFNYIYMTPALYYSVFGEDVCFNEITVRYADPLPEEAEKELAGRLLAEEGVTGVSLVTNLQESVSNMLNALNLVVWVLVIAAGLLVFVVTYNLNNINMSERRRELASLKVLGFYDMEVAMYVYRENIILTLFGIIAGLFMGTWLHRYMITILEVEMIMFGRYISLPSYLCSSLLTVAFSVIVNLFMYYKLREIDMVESLKSVE